MAIPYIILIAVLGSFAAGFGTAYKIENGEVLKLQLAVANANAQTSSVISYAQENVARCTQAIKPVGQTP